VVAPSLAPKGRGDRVKTDKGDARRLAGLHRAGELTAIAVPSSAQEAVRDLCRTRGDMVQDLTRARNRLTKFLLRHSLVYRDGSNWTCTFERWLSGLHFEDRALAATLNHYRATVQLRDRSLAAVESDLEHYFGTELFADAVLRFGAYRASPTWAACASGPKCSTAAASPVPALSCPLLG
jgi:transposase